MPQRERAQAHAGAAQAGARERRRALVGDVPRRRSPAPASSRRACPTRWTPPSAAIATHRAPARRARLRRHARAPGRSPEDARATEARARRDRAARRCRDTRVAIVSGRALGSLGEVADPPDGTLLSGSHGVELQLDAGGVTIDLRDAELDAARAAHDASLDEVAAIADGAWVERKPAGLALHTRGSRATAAAGTAARRPRARSRPSSPTSPCAPARSVLEFAVRSTTRARRSPGCASTSGADAVDLRRRRRDRRGRVRRARRPTTSA